MARQQYLSIERWKAGRAHRLEMVRERAEREREAAAARRQQRLDEQLATAGRSSASLSAASAR